MSTREEIAVWTNLTEARVRVSPDIVQHETLAPSSEGRGRGRKGKRAEIFAATFDFGLYANFRAFAQKQSGAGHFCQRETYWALSLSRIRLVARFALTVQCVLLLLIETVMKTLAKKATWNRLQPALPLMRKRCKIHKGFLLHSEALPTCPSLYFLSFAFTIRRASSSALSSPLRFMGPSRCCRDTEAGSCSCANTALGRGGGGGTTTTTKNHSKKTKQNQNGPNSRNSGNPT